MTLKQTEIAPTQYECHKFKLAVNRGLPCLKSRDLSGGLLLRRCTLCYAKTQAPLGICACSAKLPRALNYPMSPINVFAFVYGVQHTTNKAHA